MGLGEYGYIILLSVLWGASFFFMKIALRDLTPFTIVFFRVSGSAILLSLLLLVQGKHPGFSRKDMIPFLVMGALNNMIPFSLIVWGQQFVDSSVASIINASSPLFSLVLAHFLTDEERMTPTRIAGILLGISGVALLIGVDAMNVTGPRLAGQMAMVLASLCYAFAAIYGRRFRGRQPVFVASGVLTGATVLTLPFMLLLEKPFSLHPGMDSTAAMTGLILLSTSLAFVLYFKLLDRTGPTNLLLVTFLIPVSAVFLGVLILRETLSWNAWAGMSLIFVGLTVMDGRLFRKKIPQR